MTWEPLFDTATPIGWRTRAYWEFVVTSKHPALRGRLGDIIRVLADPDEIRQSRRDPAVHLFYRGDGRRGVCVAARRLGDLGFLITAYPTDSIKAGSTVWTRSS